MVWSLCFFIGSVPFESDVVVIADALGFNFQDWSLDEVVVWERQQSKEIEAFKQEIYEWEQRLGDGDGAELEEWWYLREDIGKSPKCLGDAFEVLLAVIFINANHEVLFGDRWQDDDECLGYNLSDSVEFVCAFHDYALGHWSDRV